MEQNSTADTAEKSEVPMIAHSAERAMHGSEKAPKRALSTKNKLIALAAAAGLVCGGAALLFAGSQRAPVTTQQPLYQAQITVDAAYRVHLIANELYPQEWMEEGSVYSEKLTDYIELIPTATLEGSGEAAITGRYELTAVLEGYRTVNETKQVVYSQSYSLQTGSINQQAVQAKMEAPIRIVPAEYREKAAQADAILDTSPNRDFYLLYQGTFSANTPDGATEKEFSYEFHIPLGKGNDLYELAKPEPTAPTADISTEVTTPGHPDAAKIVLGAVCLAAGAAVAWYVLRRTRPQTPEEKYRDSLREILRKYGSRMVNIHQMPPTEGRELLKVEEISQLILLSEELQQPVLYAADFAGLAKDGLFGVLSENRWYLYCHPHITT